MLKKFNSFIEKWMALVTPTCLLLGVCFPDIAKCGDVYKRQGVGLLILFRLNRDRVQNLKIVGVLYGLGVFWGIIIEFAGIVF